MPDFNKFRTLFSGKDSGKENGNHSGDSFTEGFDDDFGGGFDDDFGSASYDETNGYAGDDRLLFSDREETSDETFAAADGGPSPQRPERPKKTDIRSRIASRFKTITDLFTGNGKTARSAGVDGSDISFASEYDHAVDSGIASPPEEQFFDDDFSSPQDGQFFDDGFSSTQENRAFNEGFSSRQDGSFFDDDFSSPQENRAFEDRFSSPQEKQFFDDNLSSETDNHSYNHSREYQNVGSDYPDFWKQVTPDGFGEREDSYADSANDPTEDPYDTPPEKKSSDGEKPPEGSASGVFAAIAHAFKKFRRRLPSFRPKVYVPPEPEYHPEQDGIGDLTLASDIRKILDEQNKSGETEQEYNRMLRYVNSVSTDTRIRPGDIKQPENMGEVLDAQNELYSLINEISRTNEYQRSRIGVYEARPEEDPYNYRGINNDRQYYADMDQYSFDMDSRYGFESEKKVATARGHAVTNYGNAFGSAASQQPYRNAGYPDGYPDGYGDYGSAPSGGFSDGFNDGFDDGFDDGFSDGFSDGFDEGMDDRFSGGSGSVRQNSGGFGDGFDDGLDDGFDDGFSDGFDGDWNRKM